MPTECNSKRDSCQLFLRQENGQYERGKRDGAHFKDGSSSCSIKITPNLKMSGSWFYRGEVRWETMGIKSPYAEKGVVGVFVKTENGHTRLVYVLVLPLSFEKMAM